MEIDENKRSEVRDLIRSLLAKEESFIEVSELAIKFEKEAGYSLPLFGEKTILLFLRTILNKLQVILADDDVYVRLDEREYEELNRALAENVEKEVNKTDDNPPSESSAVDKSSGDVPEEGKEIMEKGMDEGGEGKEENKKEGQEEKEEEDEEIEENEKEQEDTEEEQEEKKEEQEDNEGEQEEKEEEPQDKNEEEREVEDSEEGIEEEEVEDSDEEVEVSEEEVEESDEEAEEEEEEVQEEESKVEEENKIEMTNNERNESASQNGNITPPHDTEEGDDCQESKEEETGINEVLCERCMSSIQCIDRCLVSIILDESDIPLINLIDHARVSDCIKVSVPEVRNPHRFILHLKKYQFELSALMRRMLMFYNVYSDKYALENYKFEKNQVCAVLHRTNPEDREWYRAKIINFGALSSSVLLIDYGIVTNANNTNIKYLYWDFGHLPVQALNGHLANIRPYRGKFWSEDCCKRLYELVFEEDLVAQVIKMDTERRWLSVILSYAEAHSFFINDNLVRGKFPVADCDFNEEESFSPVVYDSLDPKQFLQPEVLGRTRKLKSDVGDFEEWKNERNVPRRRRNKGLRKMVNLEVYDDGGSSSDWD